LLLLILKIVGGFLLWLFGLYLYHALRGRRRSQRRQMSDAPRQSARMRTLSKQEWEAIRVIARKMRDRADSFNKPSARLEAMYERSHVEARQLGYGGDIHDWKKLTREILD
jgi:hypothetical protein